MRYAVETTDVFGPEDWATHPDPLFYLTARYRRAIETMVRRAPEQYLWMHRLWRSRPPHERQGKPLPDSMRRKLELLPWMTSADVERVVDRSARDGRELAGAVG
jgi:KDO2-lipid IV(A) lauroyltransferase